MDTMATFVFPPRPSPSPSASPSPSLSQSHASSARPNEPSPPHSASAGPGAPGPAPARETHAHAASSISYDHLSLSSGRSDATDRHPTDLDDDDDNDDDDDDDEHAHAVVRAVRQSRIARPSRARLLSVHELQARARDSDPPPLPLGPLDLPPLPARPPSSTSDASRPAPAPASTPSANPTVGLGLRAESLSAPTARTESASVADSLQPPSAPYSALDVLAGSAIGATSTTPSPPLSAPSPWRPSRASLLDAALDIYAEDDGIQPPAPLDQPQDRQGSPRYTNDHDHSSDPPNPTHSPHREDWWRHQPLESDSEAHPTDTDEGPDPEDGGRPGLHPLLPMHLDVLDDPFGMAPLPSLREGATPGPPPPVPTEGLSPGTTPGATPPMRQGTLPDRPTLTPGGSPVPPPSELALPAEHVEELTDQEEEPSMSTESGEHSAFPLASPLGPYQGGSYFSLHPTRTHSTSTTTSPGEDRTEGRMAMLRAELADAETKLAAAKAANATDQAVVLSDKAAGLKKALVAHHSAVLSRQLARLPPSPSSGPMAEQAEDSHRSFTSTEEGASARTPAGAAKEGNGLLAAAVAALGPSHSPSSTDEEQISFAKAMQIIALRAGNLESELDQARRKAREHAELVAQHRAERSELERQLAAWQARHAAQLQAEEEARTQHDRSLYEAEQRAEARAAAMATQLDELVQARDALQAQHATVLHERDEWAAKHADLSLAHEGVLQEHSTLREERDGLGASHEALLLRHSELEQAHRALEQDHAQATERHAALAEDHSKLQTSHADLLAQKEEMVGRVQQLEEQLSDAERTNGEVASQLEQHKAEHAALVQHAAELEAQQADLLASKQELERQVATAPPSTDADALAEAEARAERAEQATAETREAMHSAVQAAEEQLASLASRLETAVRRASQAEDALALAQAPREHTMHDARDAHDAQGLAEQLREAQEEARSARAEAAEAQAQVDAAKAECDRLREAMFAQANVANAKLAQQLRARSRSPSSGEAAEQLDPAAAAAAVAAAEAEADHLREAMFAQANVANAKLAQHLRARSPSSGEAEQVAPATAEADAGHLREAMFAQANVANAKLAQHLRARSSQSSEDTAQQVSSDGVGEGQVHSSVTEAEGKAAEATEERSLSEHDPLQLRAELAERKLEELRRAHRELLDKHHAVRAEQLEASTALITAQQAEQRTQEALLAAQEQAAAGVDRLHNLAEVEADLRAAQRAAEEAREDLALASTQHEAMRSELEQRLAELEPKLADMERDNSELRAFRAHADDLARTQREERDEALTRADKAERGLRQLELAVAAERRILAEREGLFVAFERRLESAEARLREEDKRCAQILGKVDGREEMDNLLLQIKGVTAPKERETAGQNIDSLISSISEHITDAFDELERRGGRVHRRPGESRALDTETEDEDAEIESAPRSSDTARPSKTSETEVMARQLDEMLATLTRYEQEVAEQSKAAQDASMELKSVEADRAALEQTVSDLRSTLDAARQETQDKAVQMTLLEEQLEKAQAAATAAKGDQLEVPGTEVKELEAKARTLQRTVSSLEQELAASRTRVAELETRLVSALRSSGAGSGALTEHPELPGLAGRLEAAERAAIEAQHATAELTAERTVLRTECQRLAAGRARLSAALEAASKLASSVPRSSSPSPTARTIPLASDILSSEPEEIETLAPAPVVVRELAPSSPSERASSEYIDAQADTLGEGEEESGVSHRTLAPMSPESFQRTHGQGTEEEGISLTQLAALREEHARLRVQFNGLHEQYDRLRMEHEQVARDAAATRVELQSAKAAAMAGKPVASPPSTIPSGIEMAELLALFPHARSAEQPPPGVTPNMSIDEPSFTAKNRLAGTWPSPVVRSRSPGVTPSNTSSGSGKVDVSSLRSRFEQRSTNPSSPVMERGTPQSTPGFLSKPLPTPATPISRAGSTPPVVNLCPAGKHTPLDWARIVTEVKEMRALIHALRAQVSSAQGEKARLERFLTSMRGLLDKSIETVSTANTPAHSELALPMNGAPGSMLDEALSIVEREHGLEIPSPVLSSSSAPTAGPQRNAPWAASHRTPPHRAPSTTSTASFSQSRAASRADRQRSGGRRPFKLQPVPPTARIFEPSSSEGDVPPVPSLPNDLRSRRAPSVSRPSSQTSVLSQPHMGHTSKPSSLRTMTLGMDGRQLSMRVRDLDDAVVALETEKRQAQSQILALQDALTEAYNEMHATAKFDLSGLKLPGSNSSTPPRDRELSSSRETSVPTSTSADNMTPPPVKKESSEMPTPTAGAGTGRDELEASKVKLRSLTLASASAKGE